MRSILQISIGGESPSPPQKVEGDWTYSIRFFPAQNEFKSRSGEEGKRTTRESKGNGVVILNFFVTRTLH